MTLYAVVESFVVTLGLHHSCVCVCMCVHACVHACVCICLCMHVCVCACVCCTFELDVALVWLLNRHCNQRHKGSEQESRYLYFILL